MSLIVRLDTATAVPSAIASDESVVISVTAVADPTSTRALARYVIDAGDPFVFDHGQKEIHSDLVFVGAAGTPISTRVTISATSDQRGLLTVRGFVSERDVSGNQLDIENEIAVEIDIS